MPRDPLADPVRSAFSLRLSGPDETPGPMGLRLSILF